MGKILRAPKLPVIEARFMRFADGSTRWSFTLSCNHEAGMEAEEIQVRGEKPLIEMPPKKFYCRMCPRA